MLRGWHATSTFGAMVAAAAEQNSGLILNRVNGRGLQLQALSGELGTMTKPLHAGLVAQHGVLSALLAEGFTAADDIFENSHGYLEVFAGAERARKSFGADRNL
jgi:2-methylcitrate dehydratase PrpD